MAEEIHSHDHTDSADIHERHPHDHPHTHGGHSHTHDPEEIKKIVNRLSRSIGHLESVKRMLLDGRDCSEVLIQLSAVKSELNGAGKALLKEHMNQCIVEAVREGDQDALEKLNQAVDSFIK